MVDASESDKRWRTGNIDKTMETEEKRRPTRLADAFVVDGYGESDVRIKCCVGKEQIDEIGMSMCGRRALRYKYRCVACCLVYKAPFSLLRVAILPRSATHTVITFHTELGGQ